MFDHHFFDKIEYEHLPTNRDIYLVDEIFMLEYEKMMLQFFDGAKYNVIGMVTDVSITNIYDQYLQLQWVANIYDRFHKIEVRLPKDQIIKITGCRNSDEKIRIFIKTEWLDNLHNRSNCIFSMIDSAGMKNAIRSGSITRQKLISLRIDIDRVSRKHKDIVFVSFADSVILKYNWGKLISGQDAVYKYTPEHIISVSQEIGELFTLHFGLKYYAVLTQGINEFYNDEPLHISDANNHISLNSFGTPFAQLQEIEAIAKKAIRNQTHAPCDLYIEDHLFWSLKFSDHKVKQKAQKFPYRSKISNEINFYYATTNEFLANSLETFHPNRSN